MNNSKSKFNIFLSIISFRNIIQESEDTSVSLGSPQPMCSII
jgi:hypothetical protein